MKPSCGTIKKNLIAYLTMQLEEDRARRVRDHLTGCPSCSREAEDLQAAWDLMGMPLPEEAFKDISKNVLAKVKSSKERSAFSETCLTLLFRAPSPVLGALIALLAIPAGFYLGKNLYLETADVFFPGEHIQAQAQELPTDIFNDFPEDSLGDIYVALDEES